MVALGGLTTGLVVAVAAGGAVARVTAVVGTADLGLDVAIRATVVELEVGAPFVVEGAVGAGATAGSWTRADGADAGGAAS